MAFDKESLFKSSLPEADVEVEGVGTVRVRALSRAEAMKIQQAQTVDEIERRMLVDAILTINGDDPQLTLSDIGKWQNASPAGVMEPMTTKIAELSGMNTGAAKEAYKAFEENPDTEF